MAEARGRHRAKVSDVSDDEQTQFDQGSGRYQLPGHEASHYDSWFEYGRQPVLARPPDPRSEGPSPLGRRRVPGHNQERPEHERRPWLAAAGTATLVIAANVLALTGFRVLYIAPALGFWFLLVLPAYLLYTTSTWGRLPGPERVGYSVTAVILLLMLGGLTMNTVLPPLALPGLLTRSPL